MCQQRKKGSAQGYIRPIQSIVLQPFETFWMDWEMMAISPQTKNQQRAKKVQSIVLWNWSSRSSFLERLKGVTWTFGDEKRWTEHGQTHTTRRQQIRRCPSRLLRLYEWIQSSRKALQYEPGGSRTMTICRARCSRGGIDWWIFH